MLVLLVWVAVRSLHFAEVEDQVIVRDLCTTEPNSCIMILESCEPDDLNSNPKEVNSHIYSVDTFGACGGWKPKKLMTSNCLC